MFKVGEKYNIDVHWIGELEVVITDIVSDVIFYENEVYENSCHASHFKDMIIDY